MSVVLTYSMRPSTDRSEVRSQARDVEKDTVPPRNILPSKWAVGTRRHLSDAILSDWTGWNRPGGPHPDVDSSSTTE